MMLARTTSRSGNIWTQWSRRRYHNGLPVLRRVSALLARREFSSQQQIPLPQHSAPAANDNHGKESSPSSPATTTMEDSLRVSLFKNPIVQQLWNDREEAKARVTRQRESSKDAATTAITDGKKPSQSRVEVSYPFSTEPLLMEAYRNPWGHIRFGKMMEDLDALAGNIAFEHAGDALAATTGDLPLIVTASVDRIRLRQRPGVGLDQHLSGQVTWTGKSSMEIRMHCRDSACSDCDEWLEAFVTFVTLDPHSKKPIAIPQVLPGTPEEERLFQQGADRAALKKERRRQQKSQNGASESFAEVESLAEDLLTQAGPLLNMPSLADPDAILMQATRMQNAMIAQPQVQNLHRRIFGGFLMRRAFELAFSTAYLFGGARPIFLEVDDISFNAPVDVGDLLVFNSRVLYTDRGRLSDYYFHSPQQQDRDGEDKNNSQDNDMVLPLVHLEVEAWVTEPEKASARLSNQFYFTYAIQKPVRNVLPSNIDEARRMANRIFVDREHTGQCSLKYKRP